MARSRSTRWPSTFGRPPRFLVLATGLLLIPSAAAAGDAGPVSQGTVSISVTVAERFKVQALPGGPSHDAGNARPEAIRFCVETNSEALPAQLSIVSTGPGRDPESSPAPIPRCSDPQGGVSAPALAYFPRDSRLILVRPE